MTRSRHLPTLLLFASLPLANGCGGTADASTGAWRGTIDTLPSGRVVVRNTADPIWPAEGGWRVVEEIRIGTVEGDGPDVFGRIGSLALDELGRIWVLETQAQELRVFESDGSHVRTVGRRGGGPGEFSQALQVRLGPDGNIWVMDPQNNRFSLFDTAGAYLEGKRVPGGFMIIPWPGDFDQAGNYYGPIPMPGSGPFHMGLTRYDPAFTPVDTLEVPRDPVEREHFELRSDHGFMMASVPFSGSLQWRLAPSGHIWSLLTDEYRLTQFSASGDTLKSVTRDFQPLPVTAADMDAAREELEWFVSQGGKIDLAKLPSRKPAAKRFFVDGDGNLWVTRIVAEREDEDRIIDVFDPEGRFLGTVTLPFRPASSPAPLIRGSTLWAVTLDELEVPYVVRARLVKE